MPSPRLPTPNMNKQPDTTGLDTALALHERGYIPVAIVEKTKLPAEKWRHLYEQGRSYDSIISRWKGARLGVAIITKGMVVIDVDDENQLNLALDRCGLKEAPICKTPSGGFHVHGRMRAGVERSR